MVVDFNSVIGKGVCGMDKNGLYYYVGNYKLLLEYGIIIVDEVSVVYD